MLTWLQKHKNSPLMASFKQPARRRFRRRFSSRVRPFRRSRRRYFRRRNNFFGFSSTALIAMAVGAYLFIFKK